ncbi:MAG: hypothetical protein CMH13_08960 [Martelella sp.]|uniref:hypothetical protein n=1 Tax=unclassified Martelella TaxID=2629616 RepID=UPI000C6B6B9A|nr:hypothetical protein [Martelella sp.]MAU20648.1 hypothetical protein [Martelella sp.]|tara:strand:+ start:1418 stop:1795 length:378 start_codon:yes stop_codon:yes gene_type:complete
MPNVTRIHKDKQPIRRHYIAEWLEARDMSPMELLAKLNDPERPMDLAEVDKSQVYRWLKGQLPHPAMQARIAGALDLEDDPSRLLRSPDIDWMTHFFEGRSREEVERIRATLEAAFPKQKDGTSG